ncbi:hypothetical protein PR048_014801 [Dryococelus australis]|uniref:Sodefrin-like factor n=1 Tax=Dryococelus australis TaxID=614101 RepID=A0ABQ9HF63_9NEOP|nr:hypothetical protein PR048_014801 [Dryococelus australis]
MLHTCIQTSKERVFFCRTCVNNRDASLNCSEDYAKPEVCLGPQTSRVTSTAHLHREVAYSKAIAKGGQAKPECQWETGMLCKSSRARVQLDVELFLTQCGARLSWYGALREEWAGQA